MIETIKNSLSPQIQSTLGAVFSVLLQLFAISHLAAFAETGITSVLLFGIAETVIAVLFLLRIPALNNRDADGFDSEDMVGSAAASAADVHGSYSRY